MRTQNDRLQIAVTGPCLLRHGIALIVSEYTGNYATVYSKEINSREKLDHEDVWLLLARETRDLREAVRKHLIRPAGLVVLSPLVGKDTEIVDGLLQEARATGIHVFVSADDSPEEVWKAVQAASDNEAFCSLKLRPFLTRTSSALMSAGGHVLTPLVSCPDGARLWGLTDRESDVASLAALGLSNKQIAQNLFLGVNTVKSHLKQVFRKGGLKRRSQLAYQWAEAQRATLVFSHGHAETEKSGEVPLSVSRTLETL